MRIFIGWDSRFPEPAQVLAHTFREHSSSPLDIRFLDYRHLHDCYGFTRAPDPTASTEFSFSRFLVPYLCDYDGTALFVDNDCICCGDVAELFNLPMNGLAVRVVAHDYIPTQATKFGASGTPQAVYPRKNWSSVMLMNCSELDMWTPEVVGTAPGARLHRFEDLHDREIGRLPAEWNVLTTPTRNMKLLHYTEGGPWFEGCENCPGAELWREARRDYRESIGADPNTPVTLLRL